MDAIQEQFHQLREAWDAAYKSLVPNPAAYQPHLGGASLEQLNEAVGALGHWLDRTRAPKGFAPTFHIARALAATSLAAGISSAQALSRGELGHLPTFVVAINQTISALHTILLFSEPEPTQEVHAQLAARLSESLALLGTAQRELTEKAEQLSSATHRITEFEEITSKIGEWKTFAESAAGAAQTSEVAAAESLSKTNETAQKLEELESSAEGLQTTATEAANALSERLDALDRVTKQAQEQQRLISDLLPKGASAGLASAFANRVKQLEWSKRLWMLVFGVSMAALFFLALRIVDLQDSVDQELWMVILQRLPLAAPMIWLGWFSAVQYGNTLRVQEDYAFKEATSKAFAGYRDHMEYLASINLQEGNSAMTHMAQRTIDILAHEPLRIFKGTDVDAAPSQGFLGALRSPMAPRDAKPAPN